MFGLRGTRHSVINIISSLQLRISGDRRNVVLDALYAASAEVLKLLQVMFAAAGQSGNLVWFDMVFKCFGGWVR